jgi:hypothetical protein
MAHNICVCMVTTVLRCKMSSFKGSASVAQRDIAAHLMLSFPPSLAYIQKQTLILIPPQVFQRRQAVPGVGLGA